MIRLQYVCVQPAIPYYEWQVETMLENFLSEGVELSNVHIVLGATKSGLSDNWQALMEKYADAQWSVYPDTREKPGYISSLRPHLLEKYWLDKPWLEYLPVFYHDCDIVFSRNVNSIFQGILDGPEWHVSDTRSYTSYEYFKSVGVKGRFDMDAELSRVCQDLGMDFELVKANNDNSGGAQCLMKGVTADFWSKVYDWSEKMYSAFHHSAEGSLNRRHFASEVDGLQSWCADMYALSWASWHEGKHTIVSPNLSFSWATSPISEWGNCPIYHNAGATHDTTNLFRKFEYMGKAPYGVDFDHLLPVSCSWVYLQIVKRTGKTSCLKYPA